MELTDEEKATLEMLGLSTEDYQKQFPDKNEAGQPVNFAGQTLDDFYISMLADDSGYDFPPSVKGVGLGSVRPVTVTTPPSPAKWLADAMRFVQEYQSDAYEDAYLYLTGQGKIEKYEPSAASRIFLTPMIPPEEMDFKLEELELEELERRRKKIDAGRLKDK